MRVFPDGRYKSKLGFTLYPGKGKPADELAIATILGNGFRPNSVETIYVTPLPSAEDAYSSAL